MTNLKKNSFQHNQLGNFTLDDFAIDVTSPYFITKVANPVAVSLASLYYRLYAIFVLHKNLPGIVDNLQKIDATLQLPGDQQKSDFKRLTWYILAIVAVLPLQFYTIWNVSGGASVFAAFFLVGLFNNCALECGEFLFTSLCYLIQSRFNYINKKIQQQNKREDLSSVCKTIDTFTFRVVTPKQNYDDLIAANEIQTLRLAFQKLVKLSENVNTHFNTRLLISLGVCVFNVLTNLYMGLFGGYASGVNREISLQTMLEAFFWAGYYFSRFVWLCTACEFLCEEVRC